MKLFDKSKNIYLIKTISTSYKNIRFSYWENLLFEAIYKILTISIFTPFISLIFNKFLYFAGFNSLTNGELIRFGLSRYGFLTFIVLTPIIIGVIFIELSVLIIISYFSNYKKRINLKSALKKAFSNIKIIFGFGMIHMALYLILLLPLFNVGANSSLIPSLSIPNFISDELMKTTLGGILYLLVLAVIFYLNVRWIYSIHIVILEGETSFRRAAKKSSEIVKKNYIKTVVILISSIILFFLLYILLSFLLVSLICFIIWLVNKSFVYKFSPAITFVISLTLYYILMTITTPIVINTLTILYLDYCDKKNICIDNIEFTSADKKQSFTVKHKKVILSLVIVPALLFFVITSLLVDSSIVRAVNDTHNNFKIMAHRGYTNAGVENSLEAIEGAINANADFAEIDVLQTKDNKLIVIHDTNLKRLAKKNVNVYDLTLDEIKTLQTSQNGFVSKIPTLDEVLKLSKGRIKLNIELKLHGYENNFVDDFLNILNENDFYNECIVQSTNYNILKEVNKKAPKLTVGYIVVAGIPNVEFMDIDFLSVEESIISNKLIMACRLFNKDIYVWTANTLTSIEEYYYMGVDGVITDEVKAARELIDSISKDNFQFQLNDLIQSFI